MQSSLHISLYDRWSWGRAKLLLRRNTGYVFLPAEKRAGPYCVPKSLLSLWRRKAEKSKPISKKHQLSSGPRGLAPAQRERSTWILILGTKGRKWNWLFCCCCCCCCYKTLRRRWSQTHLWGNIKHFTEKGLKRQTLQPFSHASHPINFRDTARVSEAGGVSPLYTVAPPKVKGCHLQSWSCFTSYLHLWFTEKPQINHLTSLRTSLLKCKNILSLQQYLWSAFRSLEERCTCKLSG